MNSIFIQIDGTPEFSGKDSRAFLRRIFLKLILCINRKTGCILISPQTRPIRILPIVRNNRVNLNVAAKTTKILSYPTNTIYNVARSVFLVLVNGVEMHVKPLVFISDIAKRVFLMKNIAIIEVQHIALSLAMPLDGEKDKQNRRD